MPSLHRLILGAPLAQLAVFLVVGLLGLMLLGDALLSLAAGAACALLPSLVSSLVLWQIKPAGTEPGGFLRWLYASELLKLLGTALALGLILASGWFSPLLILAGYLGLLVAGWSGMAIAALGGGSHGR